MALKVIHVAKYPVHLPGGMEHVTRMMIRVSESVGHEVSVMCSQAPPSASSADQDFKTPTSIIKTHFKLGPVDISFHISRYIKQLSLADIVFVHLPNPMVELALLTSGLFNKVNRKVKVVGVYQSSLDHFFGVGPLWAKVIQNPLFERLDSILVSSTQMARFVSLDINVVKKISIVPWAPETLNYRRDSKQIDNQNGKINLISVGRLVEYKGFEYLIRAVHLLPLKYHLKIIGNGPRYNYLLNLVKRLDLTGRVTLDVCVSNADKIEQLKHADIYVQPSISTAESYCISLAEAFSVGLPSVVTDIPTGVRFLARGGACGALIPAENEKVLANAIGLLGDDPGRRVFFGQKNFEFFKEQLTPELFHKRMSDFFQQLLKESRGLDSAAA